MPVNPRVAKAFRAMRDLGIAEEKVKPVLKNLLKLYDKNWAPIEEENYRVLADAIFENEDAEASKSAKKMENTGQARVLEEEAPQHDVAERPLKRLRLKYQDQASDSSNNPTRSVGTSLIIPKDEPVELHGLVGTMPLDNGNKRNESLHIMGHSCDKSKGKQPVSPKSLVIHERTRDFKPSSADKSQTNIPTATESIAVPHQMSSQNKGKETLSPHFAPGQSRLEFESSSQPVYSQKAGDVQFLVQPKEEPFTGDVPECLPLAVIHPETSNEEDTSRGKSSLSGQNGAEPSVLESLGRNTTNDGFHAFSNETKTNSELAIIPDETSSQLQVASLPFGDVKISLSCDVSPLRPDFRAPSLDAVAKMVEDRCLRSYKILDQNFSVMKIMKDMCECFLELGSESYHESGETVQVLPRIDLFHKLSPGSPLVGGCMHFDIPNGAYKAESSTLGGSSKMLHLPSSCNALNDSTQPDEDAGNCNGEVHVDNETNNLDDTTCKSLVLVQQQELTPDQIRSLHDVFDISKGQERVLISLERRNNESLPTFHYIPKNAVFQNAYMNFSLARIGDHNCCSTCFGDCLSLLTPCACANETGGEFAYTVEGLVKEDFLDECISMNRDPKKHCQYFCKECPLERSKIGDVMEPCKGHLVRKFIKECWWKCGCSKKCGNRVVQRGITSNLQVFVTERKGWGLRTMEDLPKGAFVCEYVGEILTNAELFDRVSRSPKGEVHSYPVLLDADWACEGVLKDEEALCLDATFYGNVARFINHRCFDSNMVEIPVEIETPDHHYYHLAFFTTRKVQAMEELTWDYGIDFDDVEHPVKAFRCQCGSKCCRNMRRPSRSRTSSRR